MEGVLVLHRMEWVKGEILITQGFNEKIVRYFILFVLQWPACVEHLPTIQVWYVSRYMTELYIFHTHMLMSLYYLTGTKILHDGTVVLINVSLVPYLQVKH